MHIATGSKQGKAEFQQQSVSAACICSHMRVPFLFDLLVYEMLVYETLPLAACAHLLPVRSFFFLICLDHIMGRALLWEIYGQQACNTSAYKHTLTTINI